MSDFLVQARRLEDWCKNAALPFWAIAARDTAGGFYEQLFPDGTPDAGHTRRVRVQARVAYVYAHAAKLGWHDEAKTASDHAWSYMTHKGFAGGMRGCSHLLNADGTLVDGTRDTYAQAFLLLAGAWRYAAFDDKAALNIANDTLQFLNTEIRAINGGWREGLPASLPRRQNPHMHLFEAFLALHQLTDRQIYLDHAHSIFDLFESYFFSPESGDIIEFFNEDWSRAPNNGGPVEPGHMMEWCWLLRGYERLSGHDMTLYADQLFGRALEIGLNSKLGFLVDSVQDGTQSTTLRSWPQTEYLKACIAQARAGHKGMEAQAARLIDRMFDTYLNTDIDGGWHDKLSHTGEVSSAVMPTSTFYHWFCAAAEVSNYLGEGYS